ALGARRLGHEYLGRQKACCRGGQPGGRGRSGEELAPAELLVAHNLLNERGRADCHGTYAKCSGCGPMRPCSPRSSASIPSTCSSDSSKSEIRKFSSIRSGVVDFGKTTLPCWMCQRRTTWAGDLPVSSAIARIAASSSTSPWAIGDHASVAIPLSWPKSRTSRFWK